MNESIKAELNETAAALLEVLSSFTQEEFNIIPAPGKWSAAQMADHVLKSVSSFDEMITNPGKATERAPDQHVPMLKALFLDFTTQMKSPDFILPTETYYEKETILHSLTEKFASCSRAVDGTDLSLTCLNPIPGIGELTRLEAVYFTIVHTSRHVHQAKKIFSEVKAVVSFAT